jgi:hypothetical protein
VLIQAGAEHTDELVEAHSATQIHGRAAFVGSIYLQGRTSYRARHKRCDARKSDHKMSFKWRRSGGFFQQSAIRRSANWDNCRYLCYSARGSVISSVAALESTDYECPVVLRDTCDL